MKATVMKHPYLGNIKVAIVLLFKPYRVFDCFCLHQPEIWATPDEWPELFLSRYSFFLLGLDTLE